MEYHTAIGLLFDPFAARERIGQIELCWNRHQGVWKGYRYEGKASFMKAFYIAPCFQPLACKHNTTDPNLLELARDQIHWMKTNHLLGGAEVCGGRW
eukprot:GAFH01004823.1.p2 GENE.GAFH01004823.1~~GAFH01004823.1.p2  ORF type:complete len:97 (-),score=4.35 GAFH01004823.1:5-295(-)